MAFSELSALMASLNGSHTAAGTGVASVSRVAIAVASVAQNAASIAVASVAQSAASIGVACVPRVAIGVASVAQEVVALNLGHGVQHRAGETVILELLPSRLEGMHTSLGLL